MENKFKQEGKHLLYLKAEGLPDDSELDLCRKIHHAIITKREIVIQVDMPVIAKIINFRRIPQDTSSTVPKAMIILEVDANGYSKIMKLIGNGYRMFHYLSDPGFNIYTLQAKEVPTAYCIPQVLSQLVYPDRYNKGKLNIVNNEDDKINLKTILIYTDNESRQILSNNSHCDILIKKNKTSAGTRPNPIRLSVADHVFYYKGEVIGSIATPLDSTCISIKIKQDSKNAMEFVNLIKDQYPKLNFLKDVISDSIGWIESADGVLQIGLTDRVNSVNKARIKAKETRAKNTADNYPIYSGIQIALSAFESKEEAENEAKMINNDIKNGSLKIIKNTIDPRFNGEPTHAIVEERYKTPNRYGEQIISIYVVIAMLKIPIEKINTIGKTELDKIVLKLYSHSNLQVVTRDMAKPQHVMPIPAKPTFRKHFFGMEPDNNTNQKLNETLGKMHTRDKTVEEVYGAIIKSLDKIENSDSIFNAKLELLNTLRDDSLTTPVARCAIIDAIAKLKDSSTQDMIPSEIELEISQPIMIFKYDRKIRDGRANDFFVTIDIMDASFRCSIKDISWVKISDNHEGKPMITVLLSKSMARATEAYGFNIYKQTQGMRIGKLIDKETNQVVSLVNIPSVEDLSYYRREKKLKDFNGDTINFSIADMPLDNKITKEIIKSGEIKTVVLKTVHKSRLEKYQKQVVDDTNALGGKIKLNGILYDAISIYIEQLPMYMQDMYEIKAEVKPCNNQTENSSELQKIDSDQNSEVKDSNPNTASENKEEDAYVSMEYIDIKFENLRDAQKYADLLNKDCSKITKTEFLPIVKNDIFKDFKGLVKSAEVRIGCQNGDCERNCYYVILTILVNKSLVWNLFNKGITLDMIKQSARIRVKTIAKGELETITICNASKRDINNAMLEMNDIIENNNMKWINADGRYEILYLYPKAIKKLPGMFKIKAKAIKC